MRTNNNQQNYNSSNRKQLPPHLKSINSPNLSHSPSKIDLDSSSNYKKMNTLTCCNHTNKTANYFVADQSPLQSVQAYCQRCAILLASQGVNVTKIKSSGCNRRDQIQTFLQQIKQFQTQLDEKNSEIKQLLIGSQEFYGNQIEEVDNYFKIIYQSLQLQKNKCYNYILKQRQSAQLNMREIKTRIEQLSQQIVQIEQDIQQSSQVIYDLDQKTYKPVIVSYQNKLKKFQQQAKQWQISSVQYRKIQFAGVPQDLFSLSDIVIKNSSSQYCLQNIQNLQNISQLNPKDKNNSMMFSFENNSGMTPGQSQQNLRNYLKMWD